MSVLKNAPMVVKNQKSVNTSKMRFTNNRLTGLRVDKTWLGSTVGLNKKKLQLKSTFKSRVYFRNLTIFKKN